VRFTEPQPIGYAFWSSWRGWALLAAVGGSAWLSGCKTPMPAPAPAPAPSTRPAPAPAPSGQAARTLAEFRLLAARRLVEANPSMVYLEDAPEPLLAIPVLEAELDADGRILKINVLRYPSQAKDTTQLAIDAMKRAAPYGDMRRLPKPWRYTEVFLFDDNRRFKPRTLDE
jgi:hypothetical protein